MTGVEGCGRAIHDSRTWRLLCVALLGFSGLACAGSLQVMPTLLTLAANDNAQGLWLSNTGDASLNAQVRVFRWTQANGQERMEPSDEIIASPPMLTLGAGERQLVRIVRPNAAPPGPVEVAYRMLIDELPDPNEHKPGIRFVLRYSVPIFVEPEHPVSPVLRTSLWLRDGQQPQLLIRNSGGEHAQFSGVSLVDASGHSTVLAEGMLGYVLPGSARSWPVPLPATALGGKFRIKARVNAQPFEQPAPVETQSR